MRSHLRPLQGTHDFISFDHGSSIVRGVLDAVGRVSENKVIDFERHVSKGLSIVNKRRLQQGVYVDGVAGHCHEINLSAEQMKNATFVWEERFDASQISRGIAAIVSGYHTIVVSHYPHAADAAVATPEQALWELGLILVVFYSLGPLHDVALQQSED
jgi:hypothetical protein